MRISLAIVPIIIGVNEPFDLALFFLTFTKKAIILGIITARNEVGARLYFHRRV